MHRSRSIAFICSTLAALAAIVAPALADDDHMAGGKHMADGEHMASSSTAVTGTVNSINAAERKVNITHEAIPTLEWPGMTMDFQLGETASLEGIEAGTEVTFQLRKLASGAFEIESLTVLKE